MRWIFNFIALLFLAGTAQAQDGTGTFDSLEKLVTTSQKPDDKARRAEASMQYNLRAYALAKSLGYETGLGYSAQNVGINHLALSRFDSALFYFYEMKKKTKDRWGEVASLQYIGKTCLEMGDSNSGLDYLRQALALAKEIQAKPRVLETYQLLAEAYEKLEEPALAYQYLKLYTVLKDSLVNENMQQKMANAQTTYHLQQREEALTQKTQEIRTIYIISIIGAFFALAVLLWLAYSKMSQQYALNDELKQKNLLISKQNQQMEVLLDGRKVKRKNADEAERIQIKSNPLKRVAFITK